VTGFDPEGDFSTPVALGGFLPPFTLKFKDELNQLAIPNGRFIVKLLSSEMNFRYKSLDNPEFEAR
jgi:hypothetical protein